MTQTLRSSHVRCDRCALRYGLYMRGCPSCMTIPPAFTQAIAAFDYEAPWDSLMGRYKSEHRFQLSTALVYLMVKAMNQAGGVEGRAQSRSPYVLKANTVLIPIPSSDASLRKRGFNPAAELAAGLGQHFNLPVRRGVLRRLREGARQAIRRRRDRLVATHGLFGCEGSLAGVSVGLVDDVMTTGSTVNAAAQALLRAGAEDVTVLLAARTPFYECWPSSPTGNVRD
jgi:ComF family protein